ncbi:MAG: ATP-dependent metallopeptidase FtsH/Yme1/Tma family protein [Alphaproteobacteria bacterium]|nr:ATP-dependent metallopeptidase FtsH/Yme1/Tma family protein [Alphaproteobacteria bacterium]
MNFNKNILTWAIIAFILFAAVNAFKAPNAQKAQEVSFSQFMDSANAGNISEVLIKGRKIVGKTVSGESFFLFYPYDPNMVTELRDKNISISVAAPEDGSISFGDILFSLLPLLLLVGVWFFFMRQMKDSNGKAMSFGKSRARMLGEGMERVTFHDVAGIEEAKEELFEVVDFLKDPKKFEVLGGKIPKGVLLVGPPGTGKTLLARAIAGEANVPFFAISGSDFVEMFVGVGASRVRDMFEQGKKNAPCIIFIDEIDAVGRQRGAGLGGGNDEREQTLNQLLVEMDGFEANQGIILIAATNRPDVLDPALLRPGRFDREIVVNNPDINGRIKILEVHTKKVPLAPDVDIAVIARGTPGFSGADIANLVNESALYAARQNKRLVTMSDLEFAKDKVMMGSERRSMIMTDEEKRNTAYHEAGHAICALHEPASDPIHKATIIPRGRALGMVMRLPERDQYSYSREKMHADLCIAMGGRVAEELTFGYDKVTSGAISDIKSASDLARKMVAEWGLSDKLGPIAYDTPSGEVFLGHSIANRKNIADKTAESVDGEIRKVVDVAYDKAKKILTENKDELEKLANALIEFETLNHDEIQAVVKGKKITRETYKKVTSVPSTSSDKNDKKKDEEKSSKAKTKTKTTKKPKTKTEKEEKNEE